MTESFKNGIINWVENTSGRKGNSVMKYKQKGFKEIKLDRKRHNKIFSRKLNTFTGVSYWANEEENKLHIFYFTPLWEKLFLTIIFPAFLLIDGLGNYKECWKELVSVWKESHHYKDSCDLSEIKGRR